MTRLQSLLNTLNGQTFLLFLIGFALYANTIPHQYALDDDIVIVQNNYTQEGFSGLGKIFTSDAFEAFFKGKKDLVAGGRYRPLSVATFAIEYEVFGAAPEVNHFFNVLLFALLGALLYRILLGLFPAKNSNRWWMSLPFLITLLFVVHPIHTEVVANIKGRDEILAFIFALLTLKASLNWHDQGKVTSLLLAGLTFFLSLLAKESTLPFLAIVPLTIWTFRSIEWKRTGILMGGLILTFTGYLLLRDQMVGLSLGDPSNEILNNPFIGVGFGDRLATIFQTFGIYLIKLLVPYPLSHDYYFNQVPIISWASWKALLPAALHLGALVYGILQIWKKNPIGYGILFYFLSLSIVSNIVFSIGTTMGERFVFIPSLGFLILLVVGLRKLSPGTTLNLVGRQLAMGLIGLALLFSVLTLARNQAWQDNFTLFTTDVVNSPNSTKARTSAGGALVERADSLPAGALKSQHYRDAIGHLTEAVRIYPQHSQAYLLLGNAHFGLNDFNNALAAYDRAISIKPDFADAYKNAGVVAGNANKHIEAAAYFRQYEPFAPNQTAIWYSRGTNFMKARQGDSAIFAFQRVLQLDPSNWESTGNIALIYGRDLGRLDLAIQYGQQAIAQQPTADWLYENLGIAYAMSGDLNKSIEVFQNGIKQIPNSAKLYFNAGITYRNLSNLTLANQMFAKAKQLDPSMATPP